MWLRQNKQAEIVGGDIWEIMGETDVQDLPCSWKIFDLYSELGEKSLEGWCREAIGSNLLGCMLWVD